MPRINRLPISFSAFCSWFVPLLFFLPSAIGGWFIYFGLLSPAHMLLASVVISFIAAFYLAMAEINEGKVK